MVNFIFGNLALGRNSCSKCIWVGPCEGSSLQIYIYIYIERERGLYKNKMFYIRKLTAYFIQ